MTEGLPYGDHNFIYGWLDTPMDNLPPILPNEFVPIFFSMLESIIPTTVDGFFSQGLNKRMGTTGLDVKGIAGVAAENNMSI